MITKSELMQRICELEISQDMLFEEIDELKKRVKKLEPAKKTTRKVKKDAKVSK